MRTAWKGSIFANSNTVLSERGRNGFEICWQRKIHSYETRTRRGRVIFSVADLYGIKCKNRVAHQIVKSCHRGRALHGVRVCMNVSEENGARSARRGIVVCDDLCLERERERECVGGCLCRICSDLACSRMCMRTCVRPNCSGEFVCRQTPATPFASQTDKRTGFCFLVVG